MAKKLSTQEILARARAEAGQASSEPPSDSAPADSAPSDVADSPAAPAASGSPAAKTPSAASSETPKSTQDILAAARAQAAASTGEGKAAAAVPKAAKPAASAGKPASTKDILAAARAQAGAGAKPASSGVATDKAKAPKKKVAASAPAGELPSVQEMLRAVREGVKTKPSSKVEPERAPVMPAIPQRPVSQPKPEAKQTPRRSALVAILLAPFALVSTVFAAAWTVLAATGAVWSLAGARFMMPNVLVEPPTRFKIGSPSDFPPESVSTKLKAERGIWVVNTAQYDGQQSITALISVCTHLGCTPNWLEGEQKFKCPCHGSGFYITGINFEGPAPRPLERAAIRLADDGMLEVDKSRKFQEELGQWKDAASFVEVT